MGVFIVYIIFLFFYPISAGATWDINGAAVGRITIHNFKNTDLSLHGAEINLRYTYSDDMGDRLLLFFQIPYSSHLGSDKFFQHYGDVYLILKGRLGEPNIRLGRFDIPFGLIKTTDIHFSLLPYLYDLSLETKKDIGAEIFGEYKFMNYNLAITRGFNRLAAPRFDMPLSLRVGIDLVSIDLKTGASFLSSTMTQSANDFRRFGFDIEKRFNPFIFTIELVYGDKPKGQGFSLLLDFPSFFATDGKMIYRQWDYTESAKNIGAELKKDLSFLTFGIGFIWSLNQTREKELILQTEVKI